MNNTMDRRVEVGQIYRHFKGNSYEIIALAINADNREDVVVYKALYGEGKVFVRSYREFVSLVDRKKYPDVEQTYRFELLDDQGDIEADMTNEQIVIRDEEQGVNPGLLAFLETNSFQEKLHIIRRMELDIDDRLIDAMAASLDVIIPDGDIQDRIRALKNCLTTFDRFDCSDRIDKTIR